MSISNGVGAVRAAVAICTIAWTGTFLAIGCGGSGDKLKVPIYPVHGILRYKGQPAEGAVVTFNPLGQPATAPRPQAEVGADGAFIPTTYEIRDGAPEGEYAITVFWPDKPGKASPDKLGKRFADPANPVRKVKVNPGNNELEPIDLK